MIDQLHEMRAELTSALARLDAVIEEHAPSGKTPDEVARLQGMQRTKAIEWVLKQAAGKSLRPVEIWAALQLYGRNDPKMEVQVTTFDLWERGRIGKSGRGQYHAL